MDDSKKILNKNFLISAGIFIVYAVLTLIGALNHELWFDEAQAWNIARDNDIRGIFEQLKFEGHPALWYLILHIFSSLGFSCTVIPLISWFFCTVTAALILWKAPFNCIIKAAVLFSGGFLFQLSVTSRVYCLIPFFMCLIAMLYRKRNEYPICFGILVALLANTHISICGMVGILGIYMIIDLIKGWKNYSVPQNIRRAAGLGISGIGVLLLVLPLIGSMSSNSTVSEINYTVKNCLLCAAESFAEIANCAISEGYNNIFVMIIAAVIGIGFICLLILLRHYPKALAAELTFIAFFVITTNIIWIIIPTRAFIFIYSFLFVFWAAYENETPKKFTYKSTDPKLSDTFKAAFEKLKKADENFGKTYSIILTAILVCTVPIGGCLLFSDYAKDYCKSQKTAEFISSTLPPDSIIITNDDSAAPIIAYLPDYKFYSLDYNEFYTYTSHKKKETTPNTTQVYNDLKDYDHLYFMLVTPNADYMSFNPDVIYAASGNISGTTLMGYVEISTFDLEKYVS